MKKVFACIIILIFATISTFAQTQGVYSATGQGKGDTKEAATEAAKLDAINTLVFTILRRDSLYRDLFAQEALRDGRILKQDYQKTPRGSWQATIRIEIDEGLAEALYVGKYSTTVTNLLDQAEAELPFIESLLQQAGQAESQGNLGSAETYFTRAQIQTETVLRYLNPVEDTYYFSSQGKRKAPEIKIILASYKDSSTTGIERVRKAQSQLKIAQSTQQMLTIYDQIEQALLPIERSRDTLSQMAASPRAYTAEQLTSAQWQCHEQQKALAVQNSQFNRASEGLELKDPGETESYVAKRKALLEIHLKSLEQQLSSINSSISRELLWRSAPISALRWAVNHEPAQYVSFGMQLPGGLQPSDEGPKVVSMPLRLQAAAEGAIAFNNNSGLWGRSHIQTGSEYAFHNTRSPVQQEIALGFYKSNLFGLGLRWDWYREGEKPITAVEAVWGIPGTGLGRRRPHPLWITALSWEIPRETQHVLAYVNGGLESILKPNSYIGFTLQLASRIRHNSGFNAPAWVGSAALASQFRLPVLRPFRWTIGWEGALSSPITDMGIKSDEVTGTHGFTLGIAYIF